MAHSGTVTHSPALMLAPAKINLALHITGQRADGYHLLDSLVCFADIGDRLSVGPAPDLTLNLTGPMAAVLAGEGDNLVLRAARLFKSDQGAALTLEKHLPVASGIGGGSADAAACLKLLSQFWSRPMPDPAEILSLGADVPVCVAGRSARMQGIGEVVTPADLPAFHAVLINPGVGVSTPEVFGLLSQKSNPPLDAFPVDSTFENWITYLRKQRNDLEGPAGQNAPEIRAALSALSDQAGCALARMSGSGATCFGVFANANDALTAAKNLAQTHPAWWIVPTRLG